ncbi:amidohydrolase family protein [Brevibacillus sp. NRS-1366]|uniref:amidohydrolase family protein n=1 Tax=Brevibacillus sp. NRS-1366 TaxID=3233899 RepID=UPI003D25777A
MHKKFIKIKCGKLYDGINPVLQENMEVLIEGKKINAVGHNLPCPDDTELIDLSDTTITPGMIDAHVHPQFFHWKEIYDDVLFHSDGYRALATATCAKKTLQGGFTTIRSLGWWREAYELDVKHAIDKGYVEGSRLIVSSHFLCTPGSHGDMTQVVRSNPYLSDYLLSQYPTCGNGPDFFSGAVRREKKMGYDFIKIMATGGFATPYDTPEDIQFNDAELKAIIDTAKELDISITAHAYGPSLMQKLIGYGITGIEHGSMMDKETAKMFEDTGTYLVPTFTPLEDIIVLDEVSLAKKSPEFVKKMYKYQKRLREGREIIINSNIKLGYGTDVVSVYQNYECGLEYRTWLVHGMDPFRALEAATRVNAEICEIDDIVGTIQPGKLADIAGWKRDLLKDPDALRDCAFVMKEGKVYPTECRMNEQEKLD